MTGDENGEENDAENGDRGGVRGRLADAGAQAAAGSTRLQDRAQTTFQRRREQAGRAREAIDEGRSQFADITGLDRDTVDAVQLDDRGTEFGFVPDEDGERELASDFAESRPFVEAEDALVDADPRAGIETRTDPAAKSRVADRARDQTAAETEFVESDDLDVGVGPGGVDRVEIAEDRRDDVADRARETVAREDPFADAADFDAEVSDRGVEEVRLTSRGERRRAARELDEQQPDVDITPGDLDRTEDGFEVEIERERSPSSASTTSEPRGAPSEDPRRRDDRVADDLDEQFPEIDVGTDDITRTDDGFGLDSGAQREVAVTRFDQQFGSVDVRDDDVVERAGEFHVGGGVRQQSAANELDQEFENVNIGRDDVTPTDDGFGLRDDFVQDNPEILLGEQLDSTQPPGSFSP